jgi:predicted nucleic acid-binding protein
MIYIDSNVPMYLVGADHPNKRRVIEVSSQLTGAREQFITSAETFHEIVHRYLALRDRDHLNAAYEALEALVSETATVSKDDVDEARALTAQHAGLSARDALHVAVMRKIDCSRLWSYDAGFDRVPSIRRIG